MLVALIEGYNYVEIKNRSKNEQLKNPTATLNIAQI